MLDTLQKFFLMTNAEAYVEVMHNRLMRPLPESGRTGEYWGNSQRADFYPCLRDTLFELGFGLGKVIKILDVGAGSHEMIDHLLKDYPAIISAVEPNPLMLEQYYTALKRNHRLKLNSIYRGLIQSLYRDQPGQSWLKGLPQQDLILATHMIYGLSSARSNEGVHPQEDLVNFIAAMYDKLEIGGTLFIVYAIGESTILGEAAASYVGQSLPNYEKNIRSIWQARRDLLEQAGIGPVMNTFFPNFKCEVATALTSSYIYGDTVDDIASYCLLGEFTQVDESPFEIEKLLHNYSFIEKHADEFQLQRINEGSRAGMLRVATPQVVCRIKKSRRQH